MICQLIHSPVLALIAGRRYLLQENDESRSRIQDLRGAQPLIFRKPKSARGQKVSNAELRAENSRLQAFLQHYEHMQFVSSMAKKRETAQAVLSTFVEDGVVRRGDGCLVRMW